MAKAACQSNKILWLDFVFAVALLFGFSAVATAQNSSRPPAETNSPGSGGPQPERKEGTLTDIDTQHQKIMVAIPQTITVLGENPDGALAKLNKGDVVRFDASNNNEAQAASILTVNKIVTVSGYSRLLAALLAFALVILVASFCAKGKFSDYFVGLDNRTSNSQTQLVLWSATVLVAYLTTVFLRLWEGWNYLDARQLQDVIGGVEIPANLLAMSGLSALTFAGARAVTASKGDDKTRLAAQPGDAKFNDLFQNDRGQVDLGDTQMILITFVALAIYVLKTYAFLGQIELSPHVTLPDLDTTLLSTFGIGQGAYLAKKAGTKAGDG